MKKIAQETIDEIREHVRDNPSSTYGQVAARYGVSEISVKRICADLGRGKNWRQGRKQTPSNHDKFWSGVDRTGNGCWEWRGRLNSSGYGFTYFGGESQAAHRIAYTLARGPIEDGLELDHRCRNRVCCNPDHLEPVTRAENMRRVRSEGTSNVSPLQHRSMDRNDRGSNANRDNTAVGDQPIHTSYLTDRSSLSSTEQANSHVRQVSWDPGYAGLQECLDYEAENFRWGLSFEQLGARETWCDKLRTFTITTNFSDGILVNLPGRSEELVKEMFESIWGVGYNVVVRQNETRIQSADAAAIMLSRWRDHLKTECMDWQSTDEGKRSMAKKHERTLAEERDRMIDLIVDEQIELHQAEVKKQAKASRKSHQSRQLCRHCGKPRQSYKFEDKFERRESYPDEFYTDESCLDEPSSYY